MIKPVMHLAYGALRKPTTELELLANLASLLLTGFGLDPFTEYALPGAGIRNTP